MGILILTIIVAVILRSIYHKMVDVVYFSFTAVIREWITCLIIAFFLCTMLFG